MPTFVRSLLDKQIAGQKEHMRKIYIRMQKAKLDLKVYMMAKISYPLLQCSDMRLLN
jgi:hypothetical protein